MEVDSTPVLSTGNRKRKRVAKNRKKSWNKHCDVNDVEEFLHEERLHEKISGPLSKKTDEKLFAVDSKQSKKTKKDKRKLKTVKERREDIKANMEAFHTIDPYPDVEPLVKPHTQEVKKGSRRHKRLKNIDQRKLDRVKNLQADISRVDIIRSRREKQAAAMLRHAKGPDTNRFYDLWMDQDTDPPMQEEAFIEHMQPKPAKPPSSYFLKPSRLPAVEVDHPGASYNPSHADHQKLLGTALEIEVRRKKAEDALQKPIFAKITRGQLQKNWIDEMSAGLFDDKTAPETTQPIVGALGSTNVWPGKERKRRTKAARRHELQEQKRVTKFKKAKRVKAMHHDINRARSIVSDLIATEKSHKNKSQKRRAILLAHQDDTKQFNANKFVPPNLDYKLSSELAQEGSLRRFSPGGSILVDRFKSFQKRNILVATKYVRRTKAKKLRRPKLIEKKEYAAMEL